MLEHLPLETKGLTSVYKQESPSFAEGLPAVREAMHTLIHLVHTRGDTRYSGTF